MPELLARDDARSSSTLLSRLESSPRLTRAFRAMFLIFIYATFAAISFNGFYQKWGLRDGDGAWDNDARYSFVMMIEGRAHKPFIYRSLLPQMANAAEAAVPENIRAQMIQSLKQKNWWEVRSLTTQMRLAPELRVQ